MPLTTIEPPSPRSTDGLGAGLSNHDIICISSIDWDFIWQGHQEIMSTFARAGNRVLFIENTGIRPPTTRDLPRLKKRLVNWFKSVKGFRQIHERLWVYSPIILPFPYSRLARWLNRWLLFPAIHRWMRAVAFRDPIMWTFLPTGTALDLITHLDHELAVYYCIADFEQLVKCPRKVRRTEAQLVKQCDLVFAQGTILAERCRQWNPHVEIFPFGVNLEVFTDEDDASREMPDDLRDVAHPIIGYIGGLHQHLDVELIRAMALTRRGWSFVLIGPIQADVSTLQDCPNIFLLGHKSFTRLPQYVKAFDVAIIPYVDSPYTRTVYPTKLNEYHALGKPVVSTALPEVVAFNERYGPLVGVAGSPEQFIDRIQQALHEPDGGLMQRRMAVAREHGWEARVQEMSRLIVECVQRKTEAAPGTWRQQLLTIFSQTKRRVVRTASVALAAFLLVFQTPLVWWIAEPLKIERHHRAVDAIVVFGGGVGESGEAGQGHEERVAHAVSLYQSGYAPRLVLSSGYVRVFREAEVMRMLAVSLGVPREAVDVEETASNTHDAVRAVARIVQNQRASSILLVSSPYHMRRALLVFKREAPWLDVVPASVKTSRFYSHQWGASWHHLRGIAHEYLALLWYWWRGWV